MSAKRASRWLVVACVCALAALGLMTWQIVDPSVWPVMVAMSLGQVLGTASFAMFGYVVLADYRSRRRAGMAPPQVVAPTEVFSGEMPGARGEIPPA